MATLFVPTIVHSPNPCSGIPRNWKPGEATQDEEGKQIMHTLGKNMAWLMKLVEHGQGAIAPPVLEKKTYKNYIR